MNVRRSGKSISLSPISGLSASVDRGVLDAKAFRRMITLERKRSERSRKPFILLLLDMGEHLPSDKNGKTLAKILAALGGGEQTRPANTTSRRSSGPAPAPHSRSQAES